MLITLSWESQPLKSHDQLGRCFVKCKAVGVRTQRDVHYEGSGKKKTKTLHGRWKSCLDLYLFLFCICHVPKEIIFLN